MHQSDNNNNGKDFDNISRNEDDKLSIDGDKD